MNLLQQLKIKPILEPYKPIEIKLNVGINNNTDGNDANIVKPVLVIRDGRNDEINIDREKIKQRILENKLKLTKEKEKEKESIVPVVEGPVEPIKRKIKIKIKKVAKMELQEEQEGEQGEQGEQKEQGEQGEQKEQIKGEKEKIKEQIKGEKEIKKAIILGEKDWVQIGNIPIKQRIPPMNQPIVQIKSSSYYMNNREIFIHFLNTLFAPYKQEMTQMEKTISCDTLGSSSSDVNLLTHQKLIRDYMNLYTPYRGLLLFHGLGSGKTLSSIAIAEGMKSQKRIIVLTPASLRRNYMEELKKGGDLLYKKNQFWEWISLKEIAPSTADSIKTTLSSVLNLPIGYIEKKKGAWLTNMTKPSNYSDLSAEDKRSLDEQLDQMISTKYTFINYNGLRRDNLKSMTQNFENNIFNNAVVIIDEAHNFISRIVNKLEKEKPIPMDEKGEMEHVPKSLSLIMYEFLLRATNVRIVLLTGTPIINYPNEIGVLFNILRGYIKTWEIPLDLKTQNKVSVDTLQTMFLREKVIDYIDYSSSNRQLIVTRNPFGFKNKIKEKTGYQGVTNETKDAHGNKMIDMDFVSDEVFLSRIISILRKNGLDVIGNGVKIHNYKALPDKLDMFNLKFLDMTKFELKNVDLFKKRILGLTSYFRSAQEDLLPRYEKNIHYNHVLHIPMSDYQFGIYEEARKTERTMDKNAKKKKLKQVNNENNALFSQPSTTYRIFSRMFCNFVMPPEIPRPLPNKESESNELEDLLKKAEKETQKEDLSNEEEAEVEGDTILDKIGDATYAERIKNAYQMLKDKSSQYLTQEALKIYSPKYLQMLENIQNEKHKGLHLIYSQFRTLEGIGIFMLVLEQNGFAQFKLKKNSLGVWEIAMEEKDLGKPTFALYTGTESAEEKEIIRNIYNGTWDYIPTHLANELRQKNINNQLGEIIKVFMITSSGSEGINLKNTRYVHIMDTYWHPVRTQQVVGRARRICSHKDLPLELQTVEVFHYLMGFTESQIESSIELKLNDKSKREPIRPLTSDEALFEISFMKEEVSEQIIKAIKESSIDCDIYKNASNNENLKCMTFGEVTNEKMSYVPNINEEQEDKIRILNKEKVEWKGEMITIQGIKYVGRKMGKNKYNMYDLKSYEEGDPRLLGIMEKNNENNYVFTPLI